jgi:non-homologous end joining protein Ku
MLERTRQKPARKDRLTLPSEPLLTSGILRAEIMRFADELRSPSDVDLPKKTKVSPATISKFEKLISKKSKKQFSPEKLKDEEAARLLKLVKKKECGPVRG